MKFPNFSTPKKKPFSGNNILWVTSKKNKIHKFSASLLFLPVAFHESPFGRTSVGNLTWRGRSGLTSRLVPRWSKCTCYIDTYKKKLFFNVHKYILHESISIIQPILVPIRYVINILLSISNKEKKQQQLELVRLLSASIYF